MQLKDSSVAETLPSEGTARSESRKLDRILVRGLAWTGGVKWGSQLLSWLSTIVVARLLIPEDYGLVAMAGVFLGLIALLNEFGLGAAVVALRHLTDEQISKIHSLAHCFGVAAFVLVCAIASPAGVFFHSPEIPSVMIVSATGLVFAAMRSVPIALFEKELRFKFLAFLEGGQSILVTLTTIGLAWWGSGYWALVLGGVVGNAAATVVLWVVRPLRLAWPSPDSLKEAMRFSSHVLIGRLSWYAASSSDVFIGGRILGQAIVGAYSFACTIAYVPMDKVTSLASRVMPAVYSSVQEDPAALRRYLVGLTESIALITFPVGVGMALIAQDFVTVILGVKWQSVVVPLQILAAWASVRSVVGLLGPIMYVTNGSRLVMFNSVFCAVTYPVAFWVGSRFGLAGLAAAWVVVQPPSWVMLYRHVLKVAHMSLREYFLILRPALEGVALMGLCVLAMQLVFPENWSRWMCLVVEALGGAVAYSVFIVALHRDHIRKLFEMLKNR